MKNKLYINNETELIVCGGHSELTEKESDFKFHNNHNSKILEKYKLLACLSSNFEIYKKNGTYNIYSIILESENKNICKTKI